MLSLFREWLSRSREEHSVRIHEVKMFNRIPFYYIDIVSILNLSKWSTFVIRSISKISKSNDQNLSSAHLHSVIGTHYAKNMNFPYIYILHIPVNKYVLTCPLPIQNNCFSRWLVVYCVSTNVCKCMCLVG